MGLLHYFSYSESDIDGPAVGYGAGLLNNFPNSGRDVV